VINRASLLDSQLAGHARGVLWRLHSPISRTDPFSSDSAKDPARRVVDPRPAPRYNDNLQPLRGNKIFRIALREISGKLRRSPVDAKK
jgi:hypothetical protein